MASFGAWELTEQGRVLNVRSEPTLSANNLASPFEHHYVSPTAFKWAVGHFAQFRSGADRREAQCSMQRKAGLVFRENLGNECPVSGALGR